MRWHDLKSGPRWRPALAVALTGAVLVSATAGVAAIRFHVFPDAVPVDDALLEDMRGGFVLPKLGVTVHFGFEFKTLVNVPDIGAAIEPNFVAVPNGAGREIVATTRVDFGDPRHAKVTTEQVVTQNGVVVDQSTTKEKVNLKQHPIELQIGDPGSAVVTRVVDPKQVTTLIRSVVSNAHLETSDTVEITLKGVPELQRKLPSAGLTRTLENVRHALTLR